MLEVVETLDMVLFGSLLFAIWTYRRVCVIIPFIILDVRLIVNAPAPGSHTEGSSHNFSTFLLCGACLNFHREKVPFPRSVNHEVNFFVFPLKYNNISTRTTSCGWVWFSHMQGLQVSIPIPILGTNSPKHIYIYIATLNVRIVPVVWWTSPTPTRGLVSPRKKR